MRLPAVLVTLIAMTSTALAADGFERVIPGRPGVPVIENGMDISYAVVEGDYGLGKGWHHQPTIYGGRTIDPTPNVGHYYPSLGHGAMPGYGRLEIEPPANRKLPRPAESYHQSWSAQSAPLPPEQAQPGVPLYPPPVIVAPRGGEGRIQQDFSNQPSSTQGFPR